MAAANRMNHQSARIPNREKYKRCPQVHATSLELAASATRRHQTPQRPRRPPQGGQ
jgi:hypothetical protein